MDKKCNWIVGLYTLIFGLTFGLECLIFKHKMVSFWIGEVFFALSTGGVIIRIISDVSKRMFTLFQNTRVY